MKKIFFIHWNESELKEMIKPLVTAGFNVRYHFDTNKVVDLREDLPEILVISLVRLPSHGKAYAEWMWEAKKRQHIPIVFCGGSPEEVIPLSILFPKAVFCNIKELISVLEDVKRKIMTATRAIYCYDAYCGWCYGFSKIITRIADEYADKLEFEVLSGGMIPIEYAAPISKTAGYIKDAYKRVEQLSGVRFSEDYLWHINNPDKSDWVLHSEKSAIALCILKEYHPQRAVHLAADLQHALHFEGRDLTDDQAYRHLLGVYQIPEEEFYRKLRDPDYKEQAYYEFALVKQLRVTGFPAVLLQKDESKFYLVSHGFTPYEALKERIDNILDEIVKEQT